MIIRPYKGFDASVRRPVFDVRRQPDVYGSDENVQSEITNRGGRLAYDRRGAIARAVVARVAAQALRRANADLLD